METDRLAPRIQDQEILLNFTDFTSSRATCRKCSRTYKHTCVNFFTEHLQRDHLTHYNRLIKFENCMIEERLLWKYIKLRKDLFYECVLCQYKIVNSQEFSRHTHEDDARGKNYDEWPWKYCQARINNYKITCGICNKNVDIKYNINYLKRHTKNCNREMSDEKNERRENINILLWKHFRRFSCDKVQCKTCNMTYEYLNMNYFCKHIYGDHSHIGIFEITNPFNKSCRNLQQSKDSSYKCTICEQKVSETALSTHECKEDYNAVAPYSGNLWKYSVRISDFLLKCAVCPKTFPICLRKNKTIYHIEECLKKNKGTCNIERQTDAIIDTVWQHFEKESNTRAVCKLCDPKSDRSFKYVDIERTAFLDHVRRKHLEIFNHEREKQSIRRWKYVKSVFGIDACVLCNEIINPTDEFDIHTHDNDFPLYMLQNYEDWPWKYCLTFYDSRVCCDICRETIKIDYDTSCMEVHLKNVHSATLLRDVNLEDAGGPSFLTTTQQQDVGTEDTAGVSSSSGTSESPSPPKKQKIDSPSKHWRQWE